MSSIFQKIRFELVNSWRHHRLASGALALALLSAGITLGAWSFSRYETRRLEDAVSALKQSRQAAVRILAPTSAGAEGEAARLERFNSQSFTAQFHETAAGVGLPIDEVTYALEESDKVPYLRYRITMTVKARYLDVRKFIAALAADMPQVSLDSIRCARETGTPQPLSCDLAFSAFFLKDQ